MFNTALATDGNLNVIVVTSVPAGAVYIGGFAYHPSGKLYVVIV